MTTNDQATASFAVHIPDVALEPEPLDPEQIVSGFQSGGSSTLNNLSSVGDLGATAKGGALLFVNGFGGGAFYPLFAALVPDYFGENNNATNYGLVYSAKLVGGVGGGGLAASVISAWGYSGGYYLAGGIAFLSALITLLLRQPGRPADQERPAAPAVADSLGLTGAAN